MTGAKQASDARVMQAIAYEQVDVNARESVPDARMDLICVPLFRVY